MHRISLLLLFYWVLMEMVLVSEVHALSYSIDNRQAFCFLDKTANLAAGQGYTWEQRAGGRASHQDRP